MKQMTVDEVASDFSAVLNEVETNDEEVVLVRDNQPVARIVPEPVLQTALQVLGDLYQTLETDAADVWSQSIDRQRNQGTLGELAHSWVP